MKQLKAIVENPSVWDSLNNYMGDVPDAEWFCLMTRTRDSDSLTESNWRVALRKLGGESDDGGAEVQVFHFGHWACGWWEALAVRSGGEKENIAQQLFEEMEDYPILDEQDLFDLRYENADSLWNQMDARQKIRMIRRNKNWIQFESFHEMLCCIKHCDINNSIIDHYNE
jgi:hypothetical protein